MIWESEKGRNRQIGSTRQKKNELKFNRKFLSIIIVGFRIFQMKFFSFFFFFFSFEQKNFDFFLFSSLLFFSLPFSLLLPRKGYFSDLSFTYSVRSIIYFFFFIIIIHCVIWSILSFLVFLCVLSQEFSSLRILGLITVRKQYVTTRQTEIKACKNR